MGGFAVDGLYVGNVQTRQLQSQTIDAFATFKKGI